MLLLPRATRANKPPYGTPINWQNPLCRGLVADYLMNEGVGNTLHDGVNGMDLFWQGTAPLAWVGSKPDFKGQGSEPILFSAMGGPVFPGAASTDIAINSDVAPFRAFDRLNVTKAMTCEAWMWIDTRPTTFPNPVELGQLNTNGFIITMNTAPNMTFRVGNFGAPDANDATAFPNDPQQRWQQFVGTFDQQTSVYPGVAASTAVIYRDGLFRGNGGATTTWTAPSNVMRLGDGTTAGGNRWAGVFGLVRVWDRALSADEVASLYFDPFQIYRESDVDSMAPESLAGIINIALSLGASLETAIQLAGSIPINVGAQGALTAAIQMAGQILVDVSIAGDVKAAKVAERLEDCGHPLFGRCGDSWLTKKVEGRE